MNIYNQTGALRDNQRVFDAFNAFIFSEDRRVFHKLIQRIRFFQMTENLPGDIVECGVFKGSGLFTWAKLIELYAPFETKKVIGFDFFGRSFVDDLSPADRHAMESVFSRCGASNKDVSAEEIGRKLGSIGIPDHKFELVKGDLTRTAFQYAKQNPGFRISILYMDVDLEEPTSAALEAFWERVVPGGIVVFDEYGYGVWTESNAVDAFVRNRKLRLEKTNVGAPTAFIRKPCHGSSGYSEERQVGRL